MDSLPIDVLKHILYDLDCRSLVMFSRCSPKLKDFSDKHNIIYERKMRNFPRKEGKCIIHNVDLSTFIKSDSDYIDLIILNNFKYLDLILENLNNVNLVRGDIIYYNNFKHTNIYIFNGYKIIPFKYINNIISNKLLPLEFVTIDSDNISINYWNDIGMNTTINLNININMDKIKKQCIKNIKCDGEIKFRKYNPLPYYIGILYSKFTINKEKFIIFAISTRNTNKELQIFKLLLSSIEILQFTYDNFTYDNNQVFNLKIKNAIYLNLNDYKHLIGVKITYYIK